MSSYEEIEGEVTRIGAKALLFREVGSAHEVWIPMSQIENPDAVDEGNDVVSVSKWFLRKLETEGRR